MATFEVRSLYHAPSSGGYSGVLLYMEKKLDTRVESLQLSVKENFSKNFQQRKISELLGYPVEQKSIKIKCQ